jgi:hypothetical protein
MFAVIALVCFLLALLHVGLGGIGLVTLGLAFLAAHLAFGTMVPAVPAPRRRAFRR